MISHCITILVRKMWWLMHSVGNQGEQLPNVDSREWQMLKAVGQFGLYYSEQTQGILGSLMATLSLLSKIIESQSEDTEISSIRDRVQLGTGDEGWAIHTDSSLQYRGPVVVP